MVLAQMSLGIVQRLREIGVLDRDFLGEALEVESLLRDGYRLGPFANRFPVIVILEEAHKLYKYYN